MSALGATDETTGALLTGSSAVPVFSAPQLNTLELPFVQTFLPFTSCRIHFDDNHVSPFLAAYETVSFVSFSFSVNIVGQSGVFLFAATGTDSLPSKDDDWYGAPVFQHFSGNLNGTTYGEYRFPATHPFGAELKATVLGNASPRFYFKFTGDTGAVCHFRARVTLRCGGRGILSALALTKYASDKKADSVVASSA